MTSSTGYLIGIDIGTTAVKTGLFKLDGTVVHMQRTAYPTQFPTVSQVEQDPNDWLQAVNASLLSFSSMVNAESVVSIGITSQVNTHVFCDQHMQVLLPAMVWNDGRSELQAKVLDSQFSEQQKLEWWGAPMPIDASHVLSRIAWIKEECPALWDQCCHLLLPKDYCIWHLTGEHTSDPWSNIGLVDHSLEYQPELLNVIPESRALLPPIHNMTEVSGVVRRDLPFAGVPVAVGTMDAWAGIFGTGVSQQGEAVYLSGTSEVLGIVSDSVNATPGVLVMPRDHDITMHIGPTQSGGASQSWFCKLFGMEPEVMSTLAQAHRASSDATPLFLPHLQGERAPIWDSASRGVFIGLDSATDRNALAYAVYEGVAFSARWLLDTLKQSASVEPALLHVGGGGFRSDVWNQIRADVLGIELRRVGVQDPGTLGAAGIAAVATGVYGSVHEAFDDMVDYDKHYSPDTSRSAAHSDRFELYKETYHSTTSLSHRWLNG